jgi:hypothetical protein
MPVGHIAFRNTSFPGANGTSLAAIPATSTDGGTPNWAVTSGAWAADGSGAVVSAGTSVAEPNLAAPADGNYDLDLVFSTAGNLSLYTCNGNVNYYLIYFHAGSVDVLRVSPGGGSSTLATYSLSVAGTATVKVQFRRSGGSGTVAVTGNGTLLGTASDAFPPPTSGAKLASVVAIDPATTLNSFAATLAPAANATWTGPSSATAGAQSTAYTATLDEPAGAGGIVVSLASDKVADHFQATSGGGNVTTITVADGSAAGTFYITPAASGTSVITPTASGIAFSPTTKSLTVAVPDPTAVTLANTPTTGTVGAATAAIVATLDHPAPTGGSVINLASDVGGDTFRATSGGSTVTSITVAAGQTTGSFYLVPATTGLRNVSITSAGLTVSGSPLGITASAASATAFTLTGPSSGYKNNASSNFTFTPNGLYTGTITPAMSGLAGSWSPSSLSFTSEATPKTSKFTPTATGTGTANGTASPSLTQPTAVSYTSNAQTLAASPSSIPTSATTTVTFTGAGTKWATTAPTFAASGVSGVTAGSVTVVSDTQATAPVTAGSTTGTVTYTDSTTAATATQSVATPPAGMSWWCGIDGVPAGITPTFVLEDTAGNAVTLLTGGTPVDRGADGAGLHRWVIPVHGRARPVCRRDHRGPI